MLGSRGKVYLVGAGPGDPGLLTLRGKECLQNGEIILYDALVNPRILDWTSKSAKKIFVGKRGGKISISQEQIEKMMIQYAQQGKTVVRLKGGDPYLFGRGAEEAEILRKARIPFEVVPGITSALAAACYAGIPLTHRHYSSSVAIVTGHEDPTKFQSTLRWQELAKGVDTLVCLMSVSQLDKIISQLLQAGRSRRVPAALIEWGTMPHQKTVTGNLGNITEKAKKENVRPPATLVVGEVVILRNRLNWFEKRALFGRRILVTRAERQIAEFRTLLEEQGASVIALPMIAIRPLPPRQFREKIEKTTYDWVIFTSTNGVEQFLNQLRQLKMDIRILKSAKICAIGPKTAVRLESAQLKVDLMPKEEFRAEGILAELRKQSPLKEEKILLIRSEQGRNFLPDALTRSGACIEQLFVYRTEPVKHPTEAIRAIKRELLAGEIDAVTFTSPSSVANFVTSFGRAWHQKTKVASLGPITSAELAKRRIPVHIEAHPYTIEGLTQALERIPSEL